MSEIDDAWAAGFMDGEGCLVLYKSYTRDRYLSIRPYVKVNQAVFDAPLIKLHSLFGGKLGERKTRTSTGKRVYEWDLRDHAGIRTMLERIATYMLVKKPYADLFLELLQYQDGNKFGRGGNPYVQERLAIFERYQTLRKSYHVIEPESKLAEEQELQELQEMPRIASAIIDDPDAGWGVGANARPRQPCGHTTLHRHPGCTGGIDAQAGQ